MNQPTRRGPQEVALIKEPRLPYHPGLEERFGVHKSDWKALVEAVYPNAKTADAVIMALSYCKARRFDPMKRPVHIVPVWSTATGGMVETIWPGISEHRTTAMRTGLYAGCDEVEFGPDIEKTWSWVDDKKAERSATLVFPEWARMTLYRLVNGVRVAMVGPRVYWLETYATTSRWVEAPNEMWRKRPRGQLEKTAEAAALRRAFPEELGDEPTAEEMNGMVVDHAPTVPEVTAFQTTLHTGMPEEPAADPEVTSETVAETPQKVLEPDEVLPGPAKRGRPAKAAVKPPEPEPEPEPIPVSDEAVEDLPDPHAPIFEEVQSQDEVGPTNPLLAAVLAFSDCGSWAEIGGVMRELVATEDWKVATEDSQMQVRQAAWDRYVELYKARAETTKFTDQISLMRMWLLFGAQDQAAIDEFWPRFHDTDAFNSAHKRDREAMESLMKARRAALAA